MDCSNGAKMTYFDVIKKECSEYAKQPSAVFIGYNTVFGSRMYGTLDDVAPDKCLESPVAENLMAGMAIGMALEGYRPVICFERHDFMLLALDSLVNHLDKLAWMSGGQFKLPVVVRAIVGGRNKLNAGPMHTQSYATAFRNMFRYTPIINGMTEEDIREGWSLVGNTTSGAVVLIEYKDHYNDELPLASPPK